MPIQPWYVTQTSPAWTLTLSVPSNTLAPDLTGLTTSALSLIIVDAVSGAVYTGQGTFPVIDSYVNPCVVVYQPAANDRIVTTSGTYRLYVQITYSNGPDMIGPYLFTTSPL